MGFPGRWGLLLCIGASCICVPRAWGFESTLPLVVLDASGETIPDEPKIPARMRIYHGAGDLNRLGVSPLQFESAIAIEVRGRSSQLYPKKQYALKLRDSEGSSRSASLLGMPADADWILYGPYRDRSLIRNFLAYRISNTLGRYAVRTRFVELFLASEDGRVTAAGDHKGMYLLTERIEQGEHRVDLKLAGAAPPC